MNAPYDGFWLPHNIRQELIDEQTAYAGLSFAQGRPSQAESPGTVTARWPMLSSEQWHRLLHVLQTNRQQAPTGQVYWRRLQEALQEVSQRFAQADYLPRQQAILSLPSYTGYSEAMIRMTLSALDLFALEQMPAGFALQLTQQASQNWQSMPGLPGKVRFYPAQGWRKGLAQIPGFNRRSLFQACPFPNLVVGYGAGNVPGAALLIAFLAQATGLAADHSPPAVVIKNSRREPIFSPLILGALEEIDPQLVSTIAVLVWDYEDSSLEEQLLSEADLVVAAASDETISQIRKQINRTSAKHPRFHAHGHKVSFSAIARDILRRDLPSDQPLLEIVALLAALDSVFWDQHGCLSSRIHFVESGDSNCSPPLEYAQRLTSQLGLLAQFMPRGAWPLQQIHERFDRYKQLEVTGQVQVLSTYQDEFLVAIDHRPLNPTTFYSLVNDCQGRVIIVRPVENLMQIPKQYLRMLPAANLQSLSVACGVPGARLNQDFLEFAHACAQCGVTAIRTVGRGAFPQLSYSWDGLIPLDLVSRRQPGYFTTIEFDQPYEQILETYALMQQRGATLGLI